MNPSHLHRAGALLCLCLATALHTHTPAAQAVPPELPRAYVDTTYTPPTGASLYVPAGGDLQSALDSAQPGDVIALQAGASFTGNFTLPARTGTDWIILRSAAPDSALPAAGVRVQPSDAVAFPKILSPNSAPALQTAPGAQYYRILGI